MNKTNLALRSRLGWTHILLLLDYTVEFPFIVAYHPWASVRKANGSVYPLTDIVILTQLLVLLASEWAVYQSFVRFIPLFSIEESTPASRIATEFTVSRTTLLLAIAIINGPSQVGLALRSGQLHFMAVVGWMLLRRALNLDSMVVET